MDSSYEEFGPVERYYKQSDEHPVFAKRRMYSRSEKNPNINRSGNTLYNGVNDDIKLSF